MSDTRAERNGSATHHPFFLLRVRPNLVSLLTLTLTPAIPRPCEVTSRPRITDTRLEGQTAVTVRSGDKWWSQIDHHLSGIQLAMKSGRTA